MKVILLQDVKSVGKKNDVVEVKDGYAINFLIAKKLAVAYSIKAQNVLKKQITKQNQEDAKKIAAANVEKEIIEKIDLKFYLKANQGHAFGAISNKAIIDKIFQEHKIKLDKYMFDSNHALSLGVYKIAIKIYKDVIANLLIRVEQEI